jgi:hypothetical protein
MTEVFAVTSEPFYQSVNQCYAKYLFIDRMPPPSSPLNNIVKKVQVHKLSPFQDRDRQPCKYIFVNTDNPSEYATNEDIPKLFTWFKQNGYNIDSSTTIMLNQSDVRMQYPILCFINR